MTDNDLERALTAMLADGADRAPAASRSLVAQRVARTRQRPTWLVRPYGRSSDQQRSLVPVLAVLGLLLLGLLAAIVVGAGSWRFAGPAGPGPLAVGSMDTIFLVAPSGTSHPITSPAPHDDDPVWSPDGSKLVISQHDGRGRLQLIDADGANRHALVDDLTASVPATWSPDGTRIAFYGYHYPGVGARGLYVVNADGTGLQMLVPDPGPGTSRLAWSPDGTMIAFAVLDEQRPVDGARGYVNVVDLATGAVTTVSSSDVETEAAGALAWRPGGTQLLYTQSGGEGLEDIVLAERGGDTWRERPLVEDLVKASLPNPVMWLDAERFTYLRDDRLWVASLEGLPERPIGEPGLESGIGCVAPDGSAVAVLLRELAPSGEAEEDTLILVPTDGGPSIPAFTGFINAGGSDCSWAAARQ